MINRLFKSRTFVRKKIKEPPDGGGGKNSERFSGQMKYLKKWETKTTTEEKVENLKVAAAAVLINQVQNRKIQSEIDDVEMKKLQFKLFLLEFTVSDLDYSIRKMSPKANETLPTAASGNSSEEPITPGRKKTELKCSEEGCDFVCVRKDKMKRHMDSDHSSATMNSTMTSDFKNISPSSCSTQTSYTATPIPAPNLGAKRKFEDEDGETEDGPEKTKKKIDPNDTTVDESELSRAAEEAELVHKATEDAKLIEKIKMKHEEDSKRRAAKTKEDFEAAAAAKSEVIGTSIVLTSVMDGASQDPKNPFIDTGDSQESKGTQESFSLLQGQEQDNENLGELVPEDVTTDELYVTITGDNSGTGVGGVTADQELIKQVEDLESMLVSSKASEKEKANTIAVLLMKIEKLEESDEKKEKKIADMKKEMTYLRGLVRDHKLNIQSLERQNQEWKIMGEEYLLKEDSEEKGELEKLRKKVTELTKKLGETQKRVNNLMKENEKAEENVKNNLKLVSMTTEAYNVEKGAHAKTKKQILCSDKECDGGKQCPFGHKKARKINKPCLYFNPQTGKGCTPRNGRECPFLHEVERRRSLSESSKDMFESGVEEMMDVDTKDEEVESERVKGSKNSFKTNKKSNSSKSNPNNNKPNSTPNIINNTNTKPKQKPQPKTPTMQTGSGPSTSGIPAVINPTESSEARKNDKMDESIKVIGSTSASPAMGEDYKECEAYIRKKMQKEVVVKSEKPTDETMRGPEIRVEPPSEVKSPLFSFPGMLLPPGVALPSPVPAVNPSLNPSLNQTPCPSPTPSQSQSPTPSLTTSGCPTPVPAGSPVLPSPSPGVSPTPTQFPFPPYMTQEVLQHQQIQNLKHQDSFTSTKSPNLMTSEAVRVPTPIVMKNLGITEQDLAKTGVNQISTSGVWITPQSIGYHSIVDDLLKAQRKKVEEDVQAQALARAQAQVQAQALAVQNAHAQAQVQAQADVQTQAQVHLQQLQAQAQAQAMAQAQVQAQTLLMNQANHHQQLQSQPMNQKMMNLEELTKQLRQKQLLEEEKMKRDNNIMYNFPQ